MRMEVSDQKNTGIFAEKIASLHQEIQNRRPLVQCITNAVTVNDCANILLAAGASPTMAHHPQEAAEISAGCDALVCNFGAIADYEAMKSAALMATKLRHPIVIDPVGVSGSTYRRTKCIELIKKAGADCIRGNYSEIAALIKNDRTVVGVDAMQQQIDTQAMQEFARQNRLFLWASGETDILTDGERLWYCKNGDPLMDPKSVGALIETVLPFADVLTPNVPEAQYLAGMEIHTPADMETAARKIGALGCKNVLVKGGKNIPGAVDVLFDGETCHRIEIEQIDSTSTHGTGCTLSSAIASNLALGKSVPEAVRLAKEYVTDAIRHAPGLGHGCGPLDHFCRIFNRSESK